MFRNKEIQQFGLFFAFLSLVTIALGFTIHPAAGVLSTCSCAAFGTSFFLFTRARYQSIARISEQIDLVLHNEDHLYISAADEGELSILQSEIAKMTLRIREQNLALQKEKEHLADSLADIAHQLRTPLTSANLILSLLKNSPDESKRKSLLRESEELFVHMEWLINSLLKLSRLDAGIVVFSQETFNVSCLIDAALRPFLISMELHHITVRTDLPVGMMLTGDKGWLSEALLNIFKNCMEHVGDYGEIKITAKDTTLFSEITLQDSGTGFDPEDLPRLFDRFYRGKKDGATGYGIGLSLCKMIITRQGGTITAKNHPQGGALFSIRFPK